MVNDDHVIFRVGKLDVTLDVEHGEVVEMSAKEPEEGLDLTDGGFVFNKGGGGDCVVCRRIGGQWVCWDVACNLIDAPTNLKA
jgi:hypothetical protein